MEIKEFTKIMQYLANAYDKELEQGNIAVWYDFFKGYDINTFKNAILQAINQCKYYPSIAEVKELMTIQNSPYANLKADEEWENVLDSIHTYGYNQEDKALNSLKPITREIVRRIGYQDLCMMDENKKYNYRSAFIKSFDSEKQDLIRYEGAVKNDTIEMRMIQERNKEFLNNKFQKLIKKIDD